MLMQPVGAFSASGLIVLLHQSQLEASRSPEGLTGEGGELGVGGEQHQLLHFRLGGQQPIKRIAVGQGASAPAPRPKAAAVIAPKVATCLPPAHRS
jgi:hypothetical protein